MAAAKQAVRRKTEPGPRARRARDRAPRRRARAHARASRAAQQPVGGDAGRAAGGDRGGRGRRGRALGRHRRQGRRLLRRARPQGAHGPSPGCGRRPGLLRAAHAPVRQADARNRALPEAGDRGRAGHGAGGGLPARRHLRPGGGGRGGDLLHAGRQHRAVLLHAHGGAVAQRLAQAGDGDAAAGRAAAGAARRPSTASSTAWCRPAG